MTKVFNRIFMVLLWVAFFEALRNLYTGNLQSGVIGGLVVVFGFLYAYKIKPYKNN